MLVTKGSIDASEWMMEREGACSRNRHLSCNVESIKCSVNVFGDHVKHS